MKKRLLFVIESLSAAGAEKSLTTLLSSLDYSKFDVDLQLFRYGGELEKYLPAEVHLLPPFEYTLFLEGRGTQRWLRQIKMSAARVLYSMSIRVGRNKHADRARKYWLTAGRCLPQSVEQYDAAIAYSQGIPTFFVGEKVLAKQKLCWVNVSYLLSKRNIAFQTHYYSAFKDIVCVSDTAKAIFVKEFPSLSSRTTVIHDMINASVIQRMAEEEQVSLDHSRPIILTVARFAPQKGYDIALEACKILRDRGVLFTWYAIGCGPLKNEMEEYVATNNLKDRFVFLGTFANPYPYFKAATLYVQTSRNEGFGLSIAEARVLGKPVVTTEFDAVWQQMVQGKNGLVVPQDSTAVADAIDRLLTDKTLYESIVAYQSCEQIDNMDNLRKFYSLIHE
jgi:glycosyltransferase involved in cell wall biosynthesis